MDGDLLPSIVNSLDSGHWAKVSPANSIVGIMGFPVKERKEYNCKAILLFNSRADYARPRHTLLMKSKHSGAICRTFAMNLYFAATNELMQDCYL